MTNNYKEVHVHHRSNSLSTVILTAVH